MRITCHQLFLAVLFACVSYAHSGRSQQILDNRVTLSFWQISLEEAITRLEQQTRIKFVYSKTIVDTGQKVTLQARKMSIKQVLDQLLPSMISYHVINDRIVLSRLIKTSTLAENSSGSDEHSLPPPPAPEYIVRGRITDEKGAPLPGANVLVKNGQAGTSTDLNGFFELDVPGQSSILVVSFVGYVSQEVIVGAQTTIDLTLSPHEKTLDEMVVIGYGQVTKKDLTGAISSLKVDDVRAMPVSSIDHALQGQIAGVQVTQNSGAPGSASAIRIRGGNSINGGNEPLFVIDGIPVFDGTGGLNSGALRSESVNILSLINPNDISSVEVLKDASATAIYGSRGANGVILITTKSGRQASPRIHLDAYAGMQQPRGLPSMLDATQYATAINRYNGVVGKPADYTQKQIDELGTGTDWMKEITRTSPIKNIQLSVQGGDSKVKYYISGGYFSQDGILKNSGLDRYSLTLNFEKKITDKLTVFNNTLMSYARNNGVISSGGYSNTGVSSAIYTALQYDPTSALKNDNGTYRFSPLMESARLSNPAAIVNAITNSAKMVRILENLSVGYQITPELSAKISGAVDFMGNKETFYQTRSVIEGRDNNGVARLGNIQNYGFLNENTLNYVKNIGSDHRFNLLAGMTLQSNRSESVTAIASGFVNDVLGAGNLSAGSRALPPQSAITDWALLSYLARVNYGFGDRFLFTATARYDGSSRFGTNTKYGFFPSAAFAWRLSEENFLKNNQFIYDLKFRTSYGLTGNQAVSPYQSIPRLNSSRTIFNDAVNIGLYPANIANPFLGWEQTAQFDAGLDMSVAKGSLSFTLDYYRKTTSDLLLSRNLPRSSGFASTLTNMGKLMNQGIELSGTSVVKSGDWQWKVTLNLSHNRSKILDLGPLESYFVSINEGGSTGNMLIEKGQPLGNFYGYISEGIFQNKEEIRESAQPDATPGDRKFRDLSGPEGIPDGIISTADRAILGNFQPDWQFGFTNRVEYRGIDLNIVLQGVQGNHIYNSQRMHYEHFVPYNNASVSVIDAWTPENPSTEIPRLGTGEQSRPYQMSSRFIEDGSYLRFKNISIGYRIPEKWSEKLFLKNMRIYVSGQDLFTFTRYTGFDPEVNRYGQDNLRQGIDLGGYPRAKTYTIGLSVAF